MPRICRFCSQDIFPIDVSGMTFWLSNIPLPDTEENVGKNLWCSGNTNFHAPLNNLEYLERIFDREQLRKLYHP